MVRKTCLGVKESTECPMKCSNYITLKGKLVNWTGEDIIKIARDNIETIIEPIREDLAEQTYWNKIGGSTDDSDESMVLEFKNIGGNSNKANESNDGDYEWEIL